MTLIGCGSWAQGRGIYCSRAEAYAEDPRDNQRRVAENEAAWRGNMEAMIGIAGAVGAAARDAKEKGYAIVAAANEKYKRGKVYNPVHAVVENPTHPWKDGWEWGVCCLGPIVPDAADE